MQDTIAILRGINVSGKNKLRMEDLRCSLKKNGFLNVITYIQSGNILFFNKMSEENSSLELKIRDIIKKDFEYSVPVIIRTVKDMMQIISDNPFLKPEFAKFLPSGEVEEKFLHVSFLSDKPDSGNIEKLKSGDFGQDKFVIRDTQIYLYTPGGYGNTRLSNSFLEKKLNVTATTRNWKTVNKLIELSAQ